jgi:hypothetical protein
LAKHKSESHIVEKAPTDQVFLEIPFYRQTEDYSCGPACLMMAMASLDYNVEMTKKFEMEIWRESHPGEIYGTVRGGLALAARKRGFGASILSNTKDLEWLDYIEHKYLKFSRKRLDAHLEDFESRCLNQGVLIDIDTVTMEIIDQAMREGHVPIVLMNAMIFTDEDVPHWVVISGLDLERGTITLNNPLGEGPDTIPLERFHDGYGWRGKETMIEIYALDAQVKKGKKKR